MVVSMPLQFLPSDLGAVEKGKLFQGKLVQLLQLHDLVVLWGLQLSHHTVTVFTDIQLPLMPPVKGSVFLQPHP